MRKSESKVIDGYTVTVTQLPALEAACAAPEVAAMLWPLISSLQGVKSLDSTDLSSIPPSIFAGLKADRVRWLIDTHLKAATIMHPTDTKGAHAPFLEVADSVLQGQVRVVFAALVHALKVNYQSVFQGLGTGGAQP